MRLSVLVLLALAFPGASLGATGQAAGKVVNPSVSGDASATVVTAAGSTTARPLKERFSDAINVKDFGAKGDGIHNDTSAVQAAYTAAPDYATILFPPGVYVLNNNGIRLQNRTGLTFVGYGARLQAPDPNSAQYFAAWISDSPGTSFRGFTFARNNSYSTKKPANAREDGIFIERSPHSVVEDCDFSETFYGVYITDSPNVTVSRCRMIGRLTYSLSDDTGKNLATALVFVLDSSGHVSTHGQMVNCYAERVQNMIYNEDGDYWTIEGNRSKDGHDSQLYVKGAGNVISGNTIQNPGKDGIKLLANPGAERSVVANNVISKPGKIKTDGGVGITVSGGTFTVSGNVIELDTLANLAATSTRGIISEGFGVSVTGNTIIGPNVNEDAIGIFNLHNAAVYAADQYDVAILGNVVRNVKFGITVSGSATYATHGFNIRNNDVSGGYFGISIAGINGSQAKVYDIDISGNLISAAGFTAIEIDYGGGGRITGNDVIGTGGGTGLNFINSTGFEVHRNVVKSTGTGINADASTSSIGTVGNVFLTVTNPYIWAASSTRIPRVGDYDPGTAAPVAGTHATNEYVKNTSVSELGTAGSKYVVDGWRCLSGGTSGTWVEQRSATGN